MNFHWSDVWRRFRIQEPRTTRDTNFLILSSLPSPQSSAEWIPGMRLRTGHTQKRMAGNISGTSRLDSLPWHDQPGIPDDRSGSVSWCLFSVDQCSCRENRRNCLKGCVVTIDAMGTQKETAEKITDKEADYILQVKGNQETLLEDISLYFKDEVFNRPRKELEKEGRYWKEKDFDHGHWIPGRREPDASGECSRKCNCAAAHRNKSAEAGKKLSDGNSKQTEKMWLWPEISI